MKNDMQKNLQPEERQALIDAISTHRFWKPFCFTMMETGIRVLEILPLRWKDIDLWQKVITVSSVIIPNANMCRCAQATYPPLTKTVYPLSKTAVAVLGEHQRFQTREQRHKNCSSTTPDDYVFGTENGELRSYSGTTHVFQKFLRSKGLGDLHVSFPMLQKMSWETASPPPQITATTQRKQPTEIEMEM